jgi:hypothetical protein
MTKRGSSLLIAFIAVSACTPATDAGCTVYGAQRANMPYLPETTLGDWVAITDTAMTRACRP